MCQGNDEATRTEMEDRCVEFYLAIFNLSLEARFAAGAKLWQISRTPTYVATGLWRDKEKEEREGTAGHTGSNILISMGTVCSLQVLHAG